jgi:hypothetical protein
MQMTIDAMLAQCNASVNTTKANLQAIKAAVSRWGLPLTTYEAGPSIVEAKVLFGGGPTPGAADKYIALQRDARFEGIYSTYLAMYDSLGLVNASTPFMHFSSAGTPSRYGSWGLVEYTGQQPATAPKYRAVAALLDAKQPDAALPRCMDPAAAYRGLGDGVFHGQPAVLEPSKTSVWVQVRAPSRRVKAWRGDAMGGFCWVDE